MTENPMLHPSSMQDEHQQSEEASRAAYDELFELSVSDNTYCVAYFDPEKYAMPPLKGDLDQWFVFVRETLIHVSDRPRFSAFIELPALRAAFAEGAEYVTDEFRMLWNNGEFCWASITVYPVAKQTEDDESYLCYVRDVEAKRRSEAILEQNRFLQLRRSQDERYRIIVEQTGMVVFEFNFHNNVYFISPNARRYAFGQQEPAELFTGEIDFSCVHPEDVERAHRFEQDMHLGAERLETELRLLLTGGGYVWCKLTVNILKESDGRPSRIIGTLQDIDAAKRAVTELQYQAEFDELTGILNKRAFYRHTAELITNNPVGTYALVRLDIDRFKIINDLFGMEAGDKLLCYIAQCIRERLDGYGTYGRLEGDVFGMCFRWQLDSEQNMLQYAREKLGNYPLECEITPTFGVYLIDDPALSVDLMCDRANLALNTIKGSYIRRVAYYDSELRDSILREQAIISGMDKALENGEFDIYLQPKCHLDTERITGAEALVRWFHPQKGMLSPKDFIPVFERNGFIMKLDAYVWERVARLLKDWSLTGMQVLPVSVNISRINLYNPNLYNVLTGLVEKYAIDPKLMQLELTESAYAQNPEQIVELARKLQSYGFDVLMDDFGSGYSSLNVLKDLPVNILKIDMRFLDANEMELKSRGGIILESVLRMARWLRLPVVAEGVETREQAMFLRSIGCATAQGYYFSKPVSILEYERLVKVNADADTFRMEALDAMIGTDDFWNPSSSVNALFGTFVGGMVIYELHDGILELIRANDSYYELLGISREDTFLDHRNMLDCVVREDRLLLRDMFARAINTRNVAECKYRRQRPDGSELWLHSKVRYLAGDRNRLLFYGALTDITDLKTTETALVRASDAMQNLLNKLPVGVGIFELQKTQLKPLYLNEGVSFISGYSFEEYKKLTREGLGNLMEENERELVHARAIEAYRMNKPFTVTYRSRRKDGKLGWVMLNGLVFTGAGQNTVPLCYAVLFDATAQKEQELQMGIQQERYRLLAQIDNSMIFDYDVAGGSLVYTLPAEDGTTRQVEIPDYLNYVQNSHVVEPDSAISIITYMRMASTKPSEGILDYQADFYNTGYHWYRTYYSSVTDESGRVYRVMGRIADIQKEKEDFERLRSQALHDAMTGLLNKVAAQRAMEQALLEKSCGAQPCLLMIDVDDFKLVNDTYGHIRGDEALHGVSQEIERAFGSEGILGRFGGDEFIVLMPGDEPQHVHAVVDDFFAGMRGRNFGGITLTLSVGAAIATDDCSATFETLLSRADAAMYTAKAGGKNRLVVEA